MTDKSKCDGCRYSFKPLLPELTIKEIRAELRKCVFQTVSVSHNGRRWPLHNFNRNVRRVKGWYPDLNWSGYCLRSGDPLTLSGLHKALAEYDAEDNRQGLKYWDSRFDWLLTIYIEETDTRVKVFRVEERPEEVLIHAHNEDDVLRAYMRTIA